MPLIQYLVLMSNLLDTKMMILFCGFGEKVTKEFFLIILFMYGVFIKTALPFQFV